ncbi:MAG: hypothetical protein DMG22_00325 [Acidobacteria bacterium]|nr:MAG: hypothetical protein DMG22_00325 [Acidobacteriota bacterium]
MKETEYATLKTNGRPKSMRSLNRVIGLLALLIWSLMLGPSRAFAQTAPGVPSMKHVFIVFGENTGYTSSVAHMPYLDSLVSKYGLATNYVADTHPSIGNYLVWASGQIQTNDDGFSGTFTDDNIALDVQNAGLTWKDYVEDINSSCPGLIDVSGGAYAKKHDPLAYFTNITQANRVCFSQFATDLSKKTLPNLSFLAPNLCDDSHDSCLTSPHPTACTISTKLDQFDCWLSQEIAPLLASSYFQPGGDGLLVITFDEGSGAKSNTTTGIESGTWTGGQVETVVISPLAKSGYQSTNGYHHESVLRLFEEALGLTAFPGASSDPNLALSAPIDMSDFFTVASGTVSVSPTSWNFGNQTVSTASAPKTFTLSNGTTSAASVAITITGTNASYFSQTNNCPSSLAGSGGTCTINVTFDPATAIAATATLNTGISGVTAALSGTGVAASSTIMVSTTSLTFHNTKQTQTSAPQTVVVSTSSSSPIATTATTTGPFTATPTSFSVSASTPVNVTVTYTPTATGVQTGTLTITGGGSSFTITLKGRGGK